MNKMLVTDMERMGTPIYGVGGNQIEFDAPKSSLLEELFGSSLFSSISGSTSLQHETWLTEIQPKKHQTGWWSMQGDCAQIRRTSVSHARREIQDHAPAEKAATDRVTLLARKYVEKETFSDEERARLAIVTERVRQLIPSVTVAETESLDAAMQKIRLIAESDQNIRAVLRIK